MDVHKCPIRLMEVTESSSKGYPKVLNETSCNILPLECIMIPLPLAGDHTWIHLL